jgi:hypothetical protein
MIAGSARFRVKKSVLLDPAARRPGLRHHDPQDRLSMVAATTMCTRYRQVMTAIKG